MDPAKGETDYRQPDICVVARAHTSNRAIQPGAHVAIEILSPHDESRDKLPFYARQQVREVWLIDPRTMTLEVYAGMTPVVARRGVILAPALGLELEIAAEALIIRDGTDVVTVDLRDV